MLKNKTTFIEEHENIYYLNGYQYKTLRNAGLDRVKDFENLPVIGLVMLDGFGFVCAVDTLKLLFSSYHPCRDKKIKGRYGKEEKLLHLDDMLFYAGIDEQKLVALTVAEFLSIPGVSCGMIKELTEMLVQIYNKLYQAQKGLKLHNKKEILAARRSLFANTRPGIDKQ